MLDSIRGHAHSWGVKIIFGIIIIVFIFWGVGNVGQRSGHTVAAVNDREISIKEFTDEASRQVEILRNQQSDLVTNPERREEFKQQVLQALVMSSAVEQEAERLGILVSPHELLNVIGSFGLFQDDAGKFSKTKYLEHLKNQGTTPGEFEETYRKMLLGEKLQAYIASSVDVTEAEARNIFDFRMETLQAEYLLFPTADFMSGAAPTEAEVTGYYEGNKARFAQPDRINLEYLALTPKDLAAAYPVSPEEVKAYFEQNKDSLAEPARYDVRHILVRCPPEGSTEDGAADIIARAREQAAGIVAQLKKGADFSDLAREKSEDPQTAPNGGAMGWIIKGSLPAPLEKALASLKKGEISEPVRSDFGVHILMLDDKTEETPAQFDTQEAQIREMLGARKAEADFERIQTAAEDALSAGKTLQDMVVEFKVPQESTGVVAEKDVAQRLALQPGAIEILKNVPSGQFAPTPLEITDGIAVVRVRERLAAAPLPLEEVRAEVTRELADKKARELAREAAKKALPDIASGKALPDRKQLRKTEPVMRAFPMVAPLGDAPALVTALGGAPVNVWLPDAYDTPTGSVLARVVSVTPPADGLWTTQKESFMMRLLQVERITAVEAFMNRLLSSANIQVYPEVLQQLNMR